MGDFLGGDRLERTWEGALGGLDQPVLVAIDGIASAQEDCQSDRKYDHRQRMMPLKQELPNSHLPECAGPKNSTCCVSYCRLLRRRTRRLSSVAPSTPSAQRRSSLARRRRTRSGARVWVSLSSVYVSRDCLSVPCWPWGLSVHRHPRS
jgi:hypothetical protein